jgi:N-acetylmuramoyl-L-alanine amidase
MKKTNSDKWFDTVAHGLLHLIVWGSLFYFIYSLSVSTARADEVLTRSERIVALTILGEARGEGKCGMYAVACVIQKRASERNLTPARVCLQPYQFEVWNAGKGKVKKESQLYHLWKSKMTPYARQLARALCSGKKFSQTYTGGANHYCTLKTNNYWTKKGTVTKIIGNHKFFKLE